MPRMENLPDEALEPVRAELDGIKANVGYVPNAFKVMGHKPEIVKTALAFAGAVMGPGTVSPELKNMVAQIASKAAGCLYCQAHTMHSSHHLDISDAKEAALWEYETSPLFDDAERAALRVAQGTAMVPNTVTDEEFAELKAHFTDEQIVEIVAVASMFGFFNRFNDTMAPELEAAPLQFAMETFGTQGWAPGKHAAE